MPSWLWRLGRALIIKAFNHIVPFRGAHIQKPSWPWSLGGDLVAWCSDYTSIQPHDTMMYALGGLVLIWWPGAGKSPILGAPMNFLGQIVSNILIKK